MTAALLACLAPHAAAQEASERRWWNLFTTTSEEDRAILSMWTVHLHHLDEGWSNDATGALVYRGFYAASFRTTHGPRGYSLGVERAWASTDQDWFGAMLGFRTGLVYGYDNRLGWLAERYPVLPFVQPMVYARVGPLTTDLTYTWVVMSVTAGLRF